MAYLSKKLSSAEQNYPTHEKELFSVVCVAKKWRPYLDGRSTKVVTDHKMLVNFEK